MKSTFWFRHPRLTLTACSGMLALAGYSAGAAADPAAPATSPAQQPEAPPVIHSKWDATLYGFVEADNVWDSTQSFADLAGNGNIARPGTLAGDNSRYQVGARNSRIGFKLKAPDVGAVTTAAQLEMDFLGNQPGNPNQGVSEAGFFTNPTFRIRHMNLQMTSPWGTVLVGQYWRLFGWQGQFQPASVQIQGLPGEIYSRTPQIRYTEGVGLGAVRLDVALAAARPVERDSGIPDGEAGVKLSLPAWQGYMTNGSTGSGTVVAALGVSALGRQFKVPALAAKPTTRTSLNAGAIAVDLALPIVPATKQDHSNALTVTGEYSRGTGYSDMFTGLSNGVTFPAPPNPMMTIPAPTYPQNIDTGLVTFDAAGNAHTIDEQSEFFGLQYYAPNNGREWIAANFGAIQANNVATLGLTTSKVWNRSKFADASLFFDATKAVRFGLEYAWFNQTYLDGTSATDHRIQLSGFFIF